MKKSNLAIFFLLTLVLTSCGTTYNLSTRSLLEQFSNSNVEKKVNWLVAYPYVFFPGIVKGNDLKTITCVDQMGKEIAINVSRNTGVRFTKTDSSKTTFYFDTLILKDSTITGSKTHFFNAQIKPIKFKDIAKIEIMQ